MSRSYKKTPILERNLLIKLLEKLKVIYLMVAFIKNIILHIISMIIHLDALIINTSFVLKKI